MVECNVGPAPKAVRVNIGYVEAPLFNLEEEDIEDYMEEFKTWLVINKVPEGDWMKALVRQLPLAHKFIRCMFEPSAALEDILEALKLRYPRNDGRACNRGNKLIKMKEPQSIKSRWKDLTDLIAAHAMADFTDSIASKRKTGYEFKAKDYETLGCGQEEETLEQKYKRLEAELGDLVQELSNFKPVPRVLGGKKKKKILYEANQGQVGVSKNIGVQEAAEKADVNETTATLQQQAKHLQEKLVGLNLETVLHSSSDTDLSNPFETAQK
ncbi:DCTN2 [Cordylochernes scorpioides]|uniref:DCTN2 n=1 Tax=Cordylochernes scorpioides TaxID=51811 RepID=A0ABY6L4R4_9ARAC|nr:DCTN2 [Cordylochernes scorpioides]